ncbi:hypothetical protein BDN70DRAFT_864003 [Pholiota conissans]|uniref:F-box domain-containing protein n=1 Tax=Pholiota conissans TaxID=109636 RepID=A0A9P5YUA1_9AGAR|nr:hypothetical protein BDN70DRAFT_864003 [Pholiota conissans]
MLASNDRILPSQLGSDNNPTADTPRETLELLAEPSAKVVHMEAKTGQFATSPIRGLPPEILKDIFLLCLSSQPNTMIQSKKAPILLTQVCNSWRLLALQTPTLWASIHISTICHVSNAVFYRTTLEYVQKGDANEILKRKRDEAVEECLRRSGGRKLEISFDNTSPA